MDSNPSLAVIFIIARNMAVIFIKAEDMAAIFGHYETHMVGIFITAKYLYVSNLGQNKLHSRNLNYRNTNGSNIGQNEIRTWQVSSWKQIFFHNLGKNENYLYKNIWQLSWLERDNGRNHHYTGNPLYSHTCTYIIVLDRRRRILPEVVLVRRWVIGVPGIWRGEG